MKKEKTTRKVRISVGKKREQRKLNSKRKARHRNGTGFKKAV